MLGITRVWQPTRQALTQPRYHSMSDVSSILLLCRPPCRVGVDIVLLMSVSASASASASTSHQLLSEPLLKFFLGGMFFVPQGIGFRFLP